MSTSEPLTDEQANEMLAKLSRHFREPVMPISRYCKGLRTWHEALEDRAYRKKLELFPDLALDYRADPSLKERAETAHEAYRSALKSADKYTPSLDPRFYDLLSAEKTAESVGHVFLQIRKSDLLFRLLYRGEELRSTPCPEHKGRWSGLEHPDNRCPHGCQFTGWLPNAKSEVK